MNYEHIKEAADYIISKIHIRPQIALAVGIGLEKFSEVIPEPVEIMYSEIPHFPFLNSDERTGKIVFGKLGGKYVIVMCGRIHLGDGFSMQDICFPVWVLKKLGTSVMILTNSAGAINESYGIGDLVAVVDHIKLCAESPLTGIDKSIYKDGLLDMSRVYDDTLIESLKEVAYGMGLSVEEGVYAFMSGPQFETPAEVRALNVMGADIVGMSAVPEAIAASHAGIKVLAVSCITNYAAGVNGNEIISHDETKEIGEMIRAKLEALMDGLIARIKTE